jgi:hypothetical protein
MINTLTISETQRLQESFTKSMTQIVPTYIQGYKNHYKFVTWVIDESLDSNYRLVTDITALSSERSEIETFAQYKNRLKMQRMFKKYRYMFTTDISAKNGN